MNPAIRRARAQDATYLPDIERSAGERFRSLQELAWIADDDPTPIEEHLDHIAAGTVWVAENAIGEITGFVMAESIDDDLHIWEFAVRHEDQRQGIGQALIRAASANAVAAGLKAVTLTTFRTVDWNEPFYARLGFETLLGPAIGTRLLEVLAREVADGLPGERRCAMRLAL